jgi:trehalose utilization protein
MLLLASDELIWWEMREFNNVSDDVLEMHVLLLMILVGYNNVVHSKNYLQQF